MDIQFDLKKAFDDATNIAGLMLNAYSIMFQVAGMGLNPADIFPTAFIVGLFLSAMGYAIAFIKGQGIDLKALEWDFVLVFLGVVVVVFSASEKEGLQFKLFSIIVFLLTVSTALYRLGAGKDIESIFYSIINSIFKFIANSGILGLILTFFLLYVAIRLILSGFFRR
ncbi:hypothetical protein G7B40_000265 [Aetokthonos hydrillicola Thurmond2011]|jgi:hypothetical protein|uniref:Uncharacterized protein n=1 Tax=Aetokthonos hydrillicola Thurmond2011 TaxID=2712845 RepID=A0AAP5I3B1_9CYAN|nr:hypothetical protein [Aetokthonos hydrillicola]MBO3460162.1 hypothetical protein [Aetokthonos hydrillicola CCALA 1050]MBW4590572.1 hypothetical protein [Aetokthonos hydrillicola CCALA 1050]MDR9893019.1 hypothetical protein [Aetokthonos hydrillicola Thurmond2011]